MQVAVVSILLMVSACGAQDAGSSAGGYPGHAVTARTHTQPMVADWEEPNSRVTVRQTCHCEELNYAYLGTSGFPCSASSCCACCLCQRFHMVVCPWYSPVWLMHGNAAFYPGNYARHYDFREKFDYPWNGPRPPGYAQYAPPHSGMHGPLLPQFEPDSEELHEGVPYLETLPSHGPGVPENDETSQIRGPLLRSPQSTASVAKPALSR